MAKVSTNEVQLAYVGTHKSNEMVEAPGRMWKPVKAPAGQHVRACYAGGGAAKRR